MSNSGLIDDLFPPLPSRKTVMLRVLIEVFEGQVVRNLLENGLLGMLTDGGAEVLVVTPGARVPRFVERYARQGVEFQDHVPRVPSRWENYELALGRHLVRRGATKLRRRLSLTLGDRLAVQARPEAASLVAQWRPDVVASTHLSQVYGRGLVAAGRRRGPNRRQSQLMGQRLQRPERDARHDHVLVGAQQGGSVSARGIPLTGGGGDRGTGLRSLSRCGVRLA